MNEPMFRYSGEKEKDTAIPIFHKHPVLDDQKTKETGHEVYKSVDYVEIIIPGKKDKRNRRVMDADKDRWPDQWRRYQENQDAQQVVEGLPLDKWPSIDQAMAKTLIGRNVFTVEQLANMSDQTISRLGPGVMTLKQKAKAFLALAEDQNVFEKQQSQIEDLVEQVNALAADNAALKERLEEPKKKVSHAKKNSKRSSSQEATEEEQGSDPDET